MIIPIREGLKEEDITHHKLAREITCKHQLVINMSAVSKQQQQ